MQQQKVETHRGPASPNIFPAPARASRRSLVTAAIVGTILVLLPVPQMLEEAGIIELPFKFDQVG